MLRNLVINPGSTSTKIALFDGNKIVFVKTIIHDFSKNDLKGPIWNQLPMRKHVILETLKENNIDINSIDAITGRGGIIKPVKAGTYIVNKEIINDSKNSEVNHASNLGSGLVYEIAAINNVLAYISDPVCVDEMTPIAKISV